MHVPHAGADARILEPAQSSKHLRGDLEPSRGGPAPGYPLRPPAGEMLPELTGHRSEIWRDGTGGEQVGGIGVMAVLGQESHPASQHDAVLTRRGDGWLKRRVHG